MSHKKYIAVFGAIAIASTASGGALAAASVGPAVDVQAKTFKKTIDNVVVHGEKGSITKGGTPRGVCSGDSAAGALDAATGGRWTGKYYASFKDIFVTSILGVKPPGPDSWEFIVNGKIASKGICETKLKAGEKLIFKEIK